MQKLVNTDNENHPRRKDTVKEPMSTLRARDAAERHNELRIITSHPYGRQPCKVVDQVSRRGIGAVEIDASDGKQVV